MEFLAGTHMLTHTRAYARTPTRTRAYVHVRTHACTYTDLYSTQLLAESTQVGFSQSGVNSAHDSSGSFNVDSNQLKTQAAF